MRMVAPDSITIDTTFVGDIDKDGIRDDVDACPEVRETYNLYQDTDGCPDSVPAGAGNLDSSG